MVNVNGVGEGVDDGVVDGVDDGVSIFSLLAVVVESDIKIIVSSYSGVVSVVV